MVINSLSLIHFGNNLENIYWNFKLLKSEINNKIPINQFFNKNFYTILQPVESGWLNIFSQKNQDVY